MKILHLPTTNGQQPSTQTTWKPGDAIPRKGSGIEPDATRALQRNADAFEAHEREQRGQILPFKRKTVTPQPNTRGGLEAA